MKGVRYNNFMVTDLNNLAIVTPSKTRKEQETQCQCNIGFQEFEMPRDKNQGQISQALEREREGVLLQQLRDLSLIGQNMTKS